jgi:uncharacterized protein
MTNDLLLFIAVGFAAQLVDGAIGMAYGITANTALLSLGVTPATASAAIHTAEIFTTATSGAAHWRLGNVDRRLAARLAGPGMIGAAVGAYALATVPGERIRPIVSAYLLAMGGLILWRALQSREADPAGARQPRLLGFFGGLLDSIGGGGWGAIVTSTLIGRGMTPRFAIGSANAAEFFVTAVATAVFVATIGLSLWPIIAGLVLGGVLAAPLAAVAAKQIPDRPMMMLVGSVVVLLSLRNLVLSLH